MLVRNHTPFPFLAFQSENVCSRLFGVVVLRATFNLSGRVGIRLAQRQEPPIVADLYHSLPGLSSLHLESDLAPFKPRADIHVNAIAQAPMARPAASWEVSVRVGRLEKRLRVTGPRRWRREKGDRIVLGAPHPCLQVPIRYEVAFGGVHRQCGFEQNPVGVGYAIDGDSVQAPQIESPDDPVLNLGQEYAPQGFGPVCRAWQPRRRLAGTFDAAWRASVWPALPVDFDYRHYNSAHPDLIYPSYLVGEEAVAIEGCHPDGAITFRLPRYTVLVLGRLQTGALTATEAVLDTLAVDLPAQQVFLTWRTPYALSPPLRALEIRLVRGSDG